MPKIMLNDREYAGVSMECVTAWPPTSDPVQAALPEMGNTDISDVADGTITGAISSLNSGTIVDGTGVDFDGDYCIELPSGLLIQFGSFSVTANVNQAWSELSNCEITVNHYFKRPFTKICSFTAALGCKTGGGYLGWLGRMSCDHEKVIDIAIERATDASYTWVVNYIAFGIA